MALAGDPLEGEVLPILSSLVMLWLTVDLALVRTFS